MISDIHDFRQLRRAVSVERVLAERGHLVRMRRTGARLVGPCPIHGGDNPTAFSVDLTRGVWFCHTGCRRGGDVVDLVRLIDGFSYRRAADVLAGLATLAQPPGPAARTSVPRNSTPTATFRPFVRRLALEPDTPFFRAKGIRPETAVAFDAGAWSKPGFLARCVAVRLHDIRGLPLGYAGRRTDPAEVTRYGKWKFPRGLPKRELVFNLHRVADLTSRGLVVVECPWGVMRFAQLGVPAIALLGTVLYPQARAVLARAPRVVLLLDGDPAGRAAAANIRDTLAHDTDVVIHHLPDGVDPDDLDDAELPRPLLSSA